MQIERGSHCNIVAIDPFVLARNIESAQETSNVHHSLRSVINECMAKEQFAEDQATSLRMMNCIGVKVAGEKRAKVTLDKVPTTNNMQISRHTHVMVNPDDCRKTWDLQLLAYWYKETLVLVTPLRWTPRDNKTGGLWPYLATSEKGSPALACRLILALASLSWPEKWQNKLLGM